MRNSDANNQSTPSIKPWVPWMTIAATILIVAICVAIMWYRFLITPTPDCIIAVVGDKTLDGSTVVVIPKVAADPDRSSLNMKLDEDNQYSARFFLTSGTYQVMILRPDGSMLEDPVTEFFPPGRVWSYDPRRRHADVHRMHTTEPASRR